MYVSEDLQLAAPSCSGGGGGAWRDCGDGTLEELRERLQSIVRTLPDVVWSVAVPSREVLYVSPAFSEVFGRPREEVERKPIAWGDLAIEEDRALLMAAWDAALGSGAFEADYRVLTPSGEMRWIQTRGRTAKDASGKVVRMDGISRDVTERRLQAHKIAQLSRISALLGGIMTTLTRARTREELFREACRIAVQEGGFGIAWIGVLDREAGCIRALARHGLEPEVPMHFDLPEAGSPDYRANTAFRALLEKHPVVVNDISAEEPRNAARAMALKAGYRSVISLPLLIGGAVEGVMFMYARNPEFFDRDEVGLLTEFSRSIGVALEHIDSQERLRYLAQYDELTGLPNRALFHERLSGLLAEARSRGAHTALAIVDLSRFGSFNETFGRTAGDALLRELAQRLRSVWSNPDGLARISADSFALLLPATDATPSAADINAALERCGDAVLGPPFEIDGKEIRIAATAGVAVCPADGTDAETLLRNAEAAQRAARESGERLLFYRREMNAQVAETLLLENRLRKAIELEHFELHYQPKQAALGGRITGLEALIRWRDPESGLISPGRFVPILEETGLILDVGAWVMRRALRDSQPWVTPDGRPLRVAVNVSPIQLRQRDFVRVVRDAMESIPGALGRLDLEITESTIMENLEENVKKLAAVREMGVNIAVDDFGTGYSSLGYLAKLPVNALKIDRAFVATMTANAHSMTLVSTIISLARALNLKVIAEGVETEEQAKFLRLLKCDELQGYLISRPLPADQIPLLIATPPSRTA